ncbi:MAG TPA: AzlD domain-containing protein [Nocardioidaceae bacterium]|nr:AzlD domain-containing protein [Nocardioidaceae bacterium]
MTTSMTLVIATVVLGVGTYAFRLAGPLLGDRVDLAPRVEEVLNRATVVLFTALVATTALFAAHDFAGYARPAGVAVAGALAWRKAPFVVVVVAAAATAAGLRLLGVP